MLFLDQLFRDGKELATSEVKNLAEIEGLIIVPEDWNNMRVAAYRSGYVGAADKRGFWKSRV